MKTRNEQPSFKQKADSKGQNRADSRLDNCKDSHFHYYIMQKIFASL